MAVVSLCALLLVALCSGEISLPDGGDVEKSPVQKKAGLLLETSAFSPALARGGAPARQLRRFVRSEVRASRGVSSEMTSLALSAGGDKLVSAAAERASVSVTLHGGGTAAIARPQESMVELAEAELGASSDPWEEVKSVARVVKTAGAELANPSLVSEKWVSSKESPAEFDDGVAQVPQGGWIQSKFMLKRPTVVQAQIFSSGPAGGITMTVFSKDHEGQDAYSLTTGHGDENNEVKAIAGPGLEDTKISSDIISEANNANWQTVRFELNVADTKIFVDNFLMHSSTDVSKTSGYVQFIATDQPMSVREVKWRLNCVWSEWVDGDCSVSCGKGGTLMKTRKRSREPTFGGKACFGQDFEEAGCGEAPCHPPPEAE